MAASPTLIFLSLLFALANGIPDPQQDGGSASAGSDSFSLLAVNPLLPPARLQVYRGQWTPLLRRHLPITKRVLRGGRHVCRIEMEELAPIFSVAGHLEPKKFDCSFQDGDVRYYHEGNPLLNVDTVRVTIFFFRNNYSIIQTADIPVDILDHPKSMEISGRQDQRPRIRGSLELDVKNIKAGSQAISPSVVKIDYKPEEEECYLSFTRPDLQPAGRQQNEQSRLELQTGRPVVTPWWESNAGLWAPRLGRPLASGPAVGGGRRYLHRKPNSPGIDYVPLQVTIWKKLPDGDREFVTREARYLRVNIVGARPPEPPVIRIFRQVSFLDGGAITPLILCSEL
ncbi:unnamed protein product [Mesocestoides corti]|uniref:FRAS1-related extracellular matrix protein N-terminal domain-containing protein n=1 Tax=Mesocestoides corti TaxID=53468 RepID=A0A158QW78_MESCO|nr:unnamed protein product [Mesocestoides corti]